MSRKRTLKNRREIQASKSPAPSYIVTQRDDSPCSKKKQIIWLGSIAVSTYRKLQRARLIERTVYLRESGGWSGELMQSVVPQRAIDAATCTLSLLTGWMPGSKCRRLLQRVAGQSKLGSPQRAHRAAERRHLRSGSSASFAPAIHFLRHTHACARALRRVLEHLEIAIAARAMSAGIDARQIQSHFVF